MQVVTNANMVDMIQGKPIPEFKAPEAPKVAEPSPDTKVDAETTAKTDAKTETSRGDDGKFKAADKTSDGAKPDAAKAGETAVDGEKKPEVDEDDVKLTRKIEKIIAKKHRAQKEAEEFAATEGRRAIQAEQRAEALQRQIDDLRGVKSDGASAGEGKPKAEDFKTVGEYTEALVEYHAREAGKKGQQHAAESRQKAQANQMISAFVERQEAFKKLTPDYEEILESADFEVPPISQQYLIESEYGPQLAYHMAQHPEVATSLRKLSPARQLAELGKLEAKFEKPADAPKTAAAGSANGISKAPAPIQPLDAKSTPVTKDPKDMSFAELRAFRDSERRAKRA